MKIRTRKSEQGQAIILITLGMIVLFAFAGLSIDASRLFAERRHVQNVTDNGGLAGALAICREENVVQAVSGLANTNGYDNNGTTNTVDVHHPPVTGQYADDEDYVEVEISSTIQPTVIQLVYSGDLTVAARSVGFCRTTPIIPEGFPPIPFSAYAGAQSCTMPGITITGNSHNIDDEIHANDDWYLSGNGNYLGDITYGGTDIETGHPNFIDSGPTDNDTQYLWPLTHAYFDIENYMPGGIYAEQADAEGKYFYSEGPWIFEDHNGAIPDGLYYSESYVRIDGNNMSGNVTFVVGGTSGYIEAEANHSTLSPYINNILFFAEPTGETFCEYRAIRMDGNHPEWNGIIYTPTGNIYFYGNAGTTINGCLWGASVSFDGNASNVGNCADWVPPTIIQEVNLAE